MSVVVAIKSKNGVYVGADSLCTYDEYKFDKSCKLYQYGNVSLGIVGSYRDCNLSGTLGDFFKNNPFTYTLENMIDVFIPLLFETFGNFDRLKINTDGTKEFFSDFMVCTKDKIFYINSEGCVFDIEDRHAMGSGGKFALGYLYAQPNLNKGKALVEDVIKCVAKHDVTVNDNVLVYHLTK